ncbi:hypothetical protein R1sor_002659 [Riccia sorocarpa]|uniref:SAWADEE domain-containing protein n=1 Tax=Riccia sorocarpa TaxID=122646 RepID=A0ABD3H2I9_9MARC
MPPRNRRRSEEAAPPAPPLEVKSEVDNGWYDGDISLVSNGRSRARSAESRRVRVHFDTFRATEDEFWGTEILHSEVEIRRRVRLQSHQLQDRECTRVAANMVVCANFLTEDECKYYDAIVVNVNRVGHERDRRTNEEVCKCDFEVRWLEGPKQGTNGTLTCQHISLLAENDVRAHPLVRRILDEVTVTSVAAERVAGEETTRGSQAHSSAVDPDTGTTLEDLDVSEVLEQVTQVVTGNRDVRGGVDEPEDPAVPAGHQVNGMCESPVGRVSQEDCEMLDVQGVKEDNLQDEIKEMGVVDGEKNLKEGNGYFVLSEDFVDSGVLGANEVSSPSATENTHIPDIQGEGSLGEEASGGAHGSPNLNLAADIEIPDAHAQENSLEETLGDNGSPNQNLSEGMDMQGTLAPGSCLQGPEIQAATEQGIPDLEKVEDLPDEPDEHFPYVTELDWEEELRLEKFRNELDPECKGYEDQYFDLPPDAAEHLRGLQAIQTCLAKGSLALDKAFREAYLKNTGNNLPESWPYHNR